MSQGKSRGRSAEAVMTHNATGYRRGCRCDDCREDAVRRIREQRRAKRGACGVCHRIHPGTCSTERAIPLAVYVPAFVHAELVEQIPWGERSSWVVRQIRKGLDL